jgi:hypothetical protein
MAAKTTAQAIVPITEWDPDPITDYTRPADAAGGVAWAALTHSQGLGPDIARMTGPEGDRAVGPEGMDSEDVYQFLWDLVGSAAEIGYAVAQIETSGIDWPHDGAKIQTSDLARAVSALLRVELVADGARFDPGYRERISIRKAAAA